MADSSDFAALVARCEAAGEAVAAAKRTGDKPDVERKVKALARRPRGRTQISFAMPAVVPSTRA